MDTPVGSLARRGRRPDRVGATREADAAVPHRCARRRIGGGPHPRRRTALLVLVRERRPHQRVGARQPGRSVAVRRPSHRSDDLHPGRVRHDGSPCRNCERRSGISPGDPGVVIGRWRERDRGAPRDDSRGGRDGRGSTPGRIAGACANLGVGRRPRGCVGGGVGRWRRPQAGTEWEGPGRRRRVGDGSRCVADPRACRAAQAGRTRAGDAGDRSGSRVSCARWRRGRVRRIHRFARTGAESMDYRAVDQRGHPRIRERRSPHSRSEAADRHCRCAHFGASREARVRARVGAPGER